MRLLHTARSHAARSIPGSRDLGGKDLVVAILAATLVVLFAAEPDNDLPNNLPPRSLDLLAAALFVSAGAALLLRRRWPVLVLAFVLVTNGLWHKLGYSSSLINLPTFLAAYTVGLTGDRRRQIAALGLGIGPVAFAVLLIERQPWTGVIDAIGWTIVAVLFGEVVRSRGELLEAYRVRAEQAEADREAEAQRRVSEERLRIARDLHDLLGHTVSLMMVQAGVAADSLAERPERAREAITALRQAGRQATAEVRATVELLRHRDGPELAPAPSTADLATLIETIRQAGIEVDASIDPATSTLAPLVQLTIYRVVQEALTNVARHAGASQARVAVACDVNGITITIADDGRGPNGDGTGGHGLAGMRERAALAGGTVSYGIGPEGGFLLTAQLPASQAAAAG